MCAGTSVFVRTLGIESLVPHSVIQSETVSMHFYQKEISVVGTNLEPAQHHQTVGPKVNISAVGPSSFYKGQDSDLVQT